MSRYLIVGNGWVGKKLMNMLVYRKHHVKMCSHSNAIPEIVYSTNSLNRYDRVINCAGVTGTPNVDACEMDKLVTLQGNAIFPIDLHRVCEQYNIPMSHVSSGCIYEGIIDTIGAPPNYFGSTYSMSKAISDMYLNGKAQVYRIRMPFTNHHEPKNYLSKVYKYATTGKVIEGGANSLTDLDEAVSVMVDLIETNAPSIQYNLVNEGSITMHELIDLMGLSPQWYTDEEFSQVTVAKRSNCVIPSWPTMSPLHDALQRAISQLKKEW